MDFTLSENVRSRSVAVRDVVDLVGGSGLAIALAFVGTFDQAILDSSR
jgi:hypothetical protein